MKLNLVITESCCLNCTYCYMNNNPIDMSTNVIDKTIENIPKLLSIFNKRKCDIVYFGGEPLINMNIIKYTHNKVKDLSFINNELIISNLLLLDDDIINYIKSNNINVSWSFDGLWNKTNRLMKDGSESFDLYMNKLDTIKKITQGCKVMISPSSINTMTENLKFFVEELNIYSPDFSLVRDDIWSEEDLLLFEIEIKRLSEQVMNYFRNNINISVGLFTLPILDMIIGKKLGKRPFGCFVGNSGVAVMPNGDIYPCARFGTNKINNYGNILTDINYEQFKNINDKVYLDPRKFEKCKQCKLYNYCNAGCTFSQIENNNQPLDSICKLYHIIYKESINIYNTMNKENNKLYKDSIESAINNIG